jgi:hypothetical protein
MHEIPMKDMAYCGLVCGECPIFLATREPDAGKRWRMRIEIARKCNEHYGVRYGPEDITDCDGCTAESGRLFQGCRDCKIRPCAQARNLDSCGLCGDYPCGLLDSLFRTDPAARGRLEGTRTAGKSHHIQF